MRRYYSVIILFTVIIVAALGHVSEISTSSFQAEPVRAPASNSSATSETQETDAPAKKSRGASLWPEDGQRWIFRFERKVAADYQGKPWLSMKFGGRTAIEPMGMHGENRFYLLSFEADRMEMQGQTGNRLQRFPSLRAEIAPDGTLRELRLAPMVGESAPTEDLKDASKDFAAQWFFFESETRLGRAEAKIETMNSTPGEQVFAKRITSYPARPEIAHLDSNHEWAAAIDGASGSRVARIQGTENFTVGSANGDFVQRTSYQWAWIGGETIKRPTEVAVQETIKISESAPAPGQVDPAKRRIDRVEFLAVWAKLGDLSSSARLAFFERARKALEVGQSDLVADIVAGVKGHGTMSLEWRTGVGILAASSNDVAQKALVELYRGAGTQTDAKLSILAGVAAGEGKPSSEWKDVLSSELKDPSANSAPSSSSNASAADGDKPEAFTPKPYDAAEAVREASLFALGSAIRKETDETKRHDLEEMLWKEANDAKTPSDQANVLEAIGNSASKEFYSYVRTQAQSTEASVRAKAVGAVRFLASDLARPIIDAGRADASPVVRKAAEWSRKFVESGAPDASSE